MPAPRNRRHLRVPGQPTTEAYTPHAGGGAVAPPTPANRRAHADGLAQGLRSVEQQAAAARADLGIQVQGAVPGLYIQFESIPGVPLKVESLGNLDEGIEVVAVHNPEPDDPAGHQLATVFVPDGHLGHFLRRLEEYATEMTKTGTPRHRDLIDRIASVRRATLRELWTDAPDAYPADGSAIWWEVWLRRHDGGEITRLREFARVAELAVGSRHLVFDDRIVMLLRGTAAQLATSLDLLNDLAEVRGAKHLSVRFADMPGSEQAEEIRALRERTALPPEAAPAVCLLDTGITRGHPLLEPLIRPEDATAVNPAWGAHDNGGGPDQMGHGTEMAGLAAYGDLAPVLSTQSPLVLTHRLESVKILPPDGANLPELYGAVTAQGVARPEVTAPRRPRAFLLAITTTDTRDRGQPTSWSAAIDALAAGRSFDPVTQGLVYTNPAERSAQRLFVVSAGNVDPSHFAEAHLDRSEVEPIHDPAQAWNAVAVGACTDKSVIESADWAGYQPVSRPGDLSPWSTTSVPFQAAWPLKPDLVFEGGNVGRSGALFDHGIPDLCLLTTHHDPATRPLVLSWATSAAAAQVARIAAMIRSEHPALWPETVRALLIHSGRWTPVMTAHLRGDARKGARARLARRYGWGVPSEQRAMRSANDALTLIAESEIRPYKKGRMREMNIHELPWPKASLEELGQVAVQLRVTLSYFVEPNPGRRGWKRRHRYASHGLRFDVRLPTESTEAFRKRLNQRALEEDEDKPSPGSDADGWFLGEQARSKGSVHSDVWTGTAADLAERGMIGVYPVSGWWKDQPRRDRSDHGCRYALVVSIETEAEGVDIWTPVAQQIGVPVEVVGG